MLQAKRNGGNWVMIKLSEEEKQLLSAVQSMEQYPFDPETEKQLLTTRENIIIRGQLIFEELLEDWTNAFDGLLKKEFILQKGAVYALTDSGRTYADYIRKERVIKRYSDILSRSEKSKAYSSFCKRVFGIDLGQFNVMDQSQLGKLLELLNLTSENNVLDLGCGIGKITEYIADLTQAYIVGVDIATEVIQRARARTRDINDNIEFLEGDINTLSLSPATIDTIIAIDSLQFVENLEDTIGQLKALLTPRGQMGFFYGASNMFNSSCISPKNTILAHALKNHDLSFQSLDYTKEEHEIRGRQLEVAAELKAEFQVEGNLDIYSDLIEENISNLQLIESGKKRRFLYHVQLS